MATASPSSSSVLPFSVLPQREIPKKGFFNFFWPHIVNTGGEINHNGLTRRMETVLGLLGPSMAAVYTALEYCHCSHSGIITLVCCVPFPVIFAEAIEYRAAVVSARIKELVKKELPSSQAPIDDDIDDIREQAEQLLKDSYEGVAASLVLKLAPVSSENSPESRHQAPVAPPSPAAQSFRSSLRKRNPNTPEPTVRNLATLADYQSRIVFALDPKHAAAGHAVDSLTELKSN